MKNKERKLQFIRYKNEMKRKGFSLPKWRLKNRRLPLKWVNLSPTLLEDSWMIDLRGKK